MTRLKIADNFAHQRGVKQDFRVDWDDASTKQDWRRDWGQVDVSEVHTITVDATGGNFTITWTGQTTGALNFNVSAADMQTALIGLSNIGSTDLTVAGGPGDDGGTTPYRITWRAALGNVAAFTTTPGGLTGGAGTAAVATVTQGDLIPVSEIQEIDVDAGGGTFTITWNSQTTAALPYNATSGQVMKALVALSNIGPTDLTVTGGVGKPGGGDPYVIKWFHGNMAAPTTTATLLTGTPIPEVQEIDVDAESGTFTITWSAQTTTAIAFNATPVAVQAALVALSNVAPGDVVVTGGVGQPGGGTPYVLTWNAALDDVAAPTTTPASLVGTSIPEIQQIAVDATGGDFTITWSGQTTGALAFNITPGDMQTALVALSNISPGDVVVTGGVGNNGGTTPYVLTWLASLGNVAQPTTTPTGLTGGASTATPSTTQVGDNAVVGTAAVSTATIGDDDGAGTAAVTTVLGGV